MPEPVEILIVEDYAPDAQLMLLLLKRNRIANQIRVLPDGCEALDFIFCRGAYSANTFENLPRVVFLDIRMPKVDGWEVLSQIKRDPRTRQMIVIMISGSLFPQELNMARQLGADGCIAKPTTAEELRQALGLCGFAWTLVGEQKL